MSDTENEQPDRHLSVLKAAEILEGPAGEIRDVNPDEWLGQAVDTDGVVVVDGVRIKIAALTEEETQKLMKQCTRPDPARPMDPPRLDPPRFRVAIIAHSINKANGTAIQPNQLMTRKTGSLTVIQDAIMKLSGMDNGGQPTAAFLG